MIAGSELNAERQSALLMMIGTEVSLSSPGLNAKAPSAHLSFMQQDLFVSA